LIIGAQKAGTTSLYEFLSAHPRIVPNRSWKEVRFFDLPENYRQGMGWYLGNFPTRREARGRITLDASPSNLYFPQIPAQIRKHLGANILMIAVLRNPAERAYSAWKMYHSFGTNPDVAENNRLIADRRSFAEAVTEELSGRVDPEMYPYGYVGRGLYADQIENYYRVFDRRNLMCLDFRRLHKDSGNLLDEVTDFLGIARFTDEQKAQIASQRHNEGLSRPKSDEDERTMQTLRDHYREPNARLEKLLGWKTDW
jgi:DNA-binding transcriptional MerR regulator